MRVCPFSVTVTLLVHVFYKETHGPYLSVVGVSAELDIDAEAVFPGYFVGLMVEQERGLGWVGLLHQSGDGQAMTVGTVVACDDLQAVGQCNNRVAQQLDGGIL